MEDRKNTAKPGKARTCAGCGVSQAVASARSEMLRLVVTDSEVVFDLAGGAFGRGAYVHARPECLARAPRGLARAFGRGARNRAVEGTSGASAVLSAAHAGSIEATDLGARLVAACRQRMAGLLLAARRLGAVAVGSEAARDALARGMRAIEASMSVRA
jgi:predicted RNA-binding protein YlxR (DUF448 family)